MFERRLRLPHDFKHTFFLWGPRQSGKTTLLDAMYPDAHRIDLLQSDLFRRYTQAPERLRDELARSPKTKFVVIDEIQKVPSLLDEVHWLHERRGIRFALCGSSARKLRRGHANLLGGRARRFELFGLVSAELDKEFNLDRMLTHGTLPSIYVSDDPEDALDAYIGDYLREEVAAEGLVRNLPAFAAFLEAAALADAELVNASTFARDTGVSVPTVQSYFEILVDTLLGRWLHGYRKRPKRRVIGAPKFYFSDVAVVNALAKRGRPQRGSETFGRAFENWVFHELTAYIVYSRKRVELTYWRLASGIEVDFIVGDMQFAFEAKATKRVTSDHLKGLRSIIEDHPHVKRRLVVSLEATPSQTDDGVEIVPAEVFASELWSGTIF